MRHNIVQRAVWLRPEVWAAMLVVALLPLIGPGTLSATGAEPASVPVEQRYFEKWGGRERAATSAAARGRLAEQLIEAARTEESTRMAVFLCQRAFRLGSADVQTFPEAARALELMQTLNPDLRLEALDQLRGLYRRAYEADPERFLGMGIGFASSSVQVAEQRRIEVARQRGRGQLTPQDAVGELRAIERDYELARRTVNRVLHTARRLSQSLRTNVQARQQVAAFVERNEAFLEEIDDGSASLLAEQSLMAELIEAIALFQEDHSPLRAERVAMLYLVDLDSPREAVPYGQHYLPPDQQQRLAWAAMPEGELTAEQSLEVAHWYARLADRVDLSHRANMLIRAHNHLANCDDAFEPNDENLLAARLRLETVAEALAELEVQTLPVTILARGEAERIAQAQAEAEEAARIAAANQQQGGDAEPVAQSDRPEAEQPSERITTGGQPPQPPVQQQPPAEPDRTARAEEPPAGDPTALSALPTDRAGRPVANCSRCRFNFNPLPGDSTTVCPRCASGRRNIFDFGDD